MADEERKIIIDEDWKAQVQKEKEEARRKAEGASRTPDKGEAETKAPTGEAPAGQPDEPTLFQGLVQSLAAQALYTLGAIPEPGQDKVMVDLREARYLIDLLMMLREKTQGKLTAGEEGQLTEVIHELQQVYVLRAQQVQESSLRQAGVNPQDLGRKKS